MFHVLGFLVFLVFQSANAQLCIPDGVGNVTLDLNYTLYWHPSTNCEETHYLIYIHIEDELQYIYTAEETYLDVSFLPACERFYFEVNAYSNNQLSEPARLTTYIPAPSGADLTITSFDASAQDDATFLQWHVTEKFAHCAHAFRVVIHDSVGLPRDVYTERNHLFINNLIPCGRYEFAVMAIYNIQTEGPIALIDYEVPGANSTPPVLESVASTDTSVTISWALPTYSVNRCTIRSLIVDGLPLLHQIFPVDDSPARPLYNMSLTSLVPDNMYLLKVAIVNSAGTSDYFTIGVQTQPSA